LKLQVLQCENFENSENDKENHDFWYSLPVKHFAGHIFKGCQRLDGKA
jgi:hypothetical protein